MSTWATTRVVSSRETAKLVGKFDRSLRRTNNLIVEKFGEERAAVMRREMLDEFRSLIPEIPYELEKVARAIRDRTRAGKRFSIVAVAEGAMSVDRAGRGDLEANGRRWVERIGRVADDPVPRHGDHGRIDSRHDAGIATGSACGGGRLA